MRISRLRIENFRSIQSLTLELPQLCSIVGANNSGKSNLLLAMQRVLGRDWVSVSTFDDADICGHQPDADVVIEASFEPSLLYKRFKESPPVEVGSVAFEYTRYKIGPEKGQRRLEQKCLDPLGKQIFVPQKAPRKGEAPSFLPLVGIPSDVRDAIPLIYLGTNRALRDQLPSARHSMLRQLFEEINRDFQDPENVITVRVNGKDRELPRLDRFRSLMIAAVKALRTESFEALEASIRRNALRQLGFDPDADSDKLDLSFAPVDSMDFYKALDLRVRDGDLSVSATELGDGIQNALVLAILKAFEERRKKGAVLLIEEPEMFLHPQMQRSVYKTLRTIAETNQVIYTTHSPHFVSIPDYEQVAIVRKGSDGTKALRSTSTGDARRKEKLIKELDPERNELFFATRVLFVEGDTEKLALPEYALRLGLDLDQAGASIVEVGGKRNLPAFAEIVRSFEIPVGIVYDQDASDFAGNRHEEQVFNATLDKLATKDGSVRVWHLQKNYEDHLRRAMGERVYEAACNRYPKIGKPTRARLIAMEGDSAIPDPVREVLNWLAGA